jgi:oligopeptide transport system permease protein
MSTIATTLSPDSPDPGAGDTSAATPSADPVIQRLLGSGRVLVGGGVLLAIALVCLLTLPLTLNDNSVLYFNNVDTAKARSAPTSEAAAYWFGTDMLGRSLLGRCLLGGCISMLVGLAAATLSVTLGVSVGLIAGYRGGWIDAALMRFVDIMYGLPYVLLIVLFKIALEPVLVERLELSSQTSNLVVLFLAIGLVSWLTMARVVRGQVLSLRSQPFIEACRAMGLPEHRIFLRHLLPNLVGPVIVYATLTVPQAILQESFLSFLGIGIQAPMPTWGSLANDGLVQGLNTVSPRPWMLLYPCLLLATTLLSLNFLGDGLRDVFDPKREAAKI